MTDFAQESLGDVVEVGLPAVGSAVSAGVACGEIESVKSVSDLVSPFTGVISAVNERADLEPELTNTDPYAEGWLFEIQVAPDAFESEYAQLLDAASYRDLTGK